MILDTLPVLGASALLLFVIYHHFFHPLRHVPGPFYVSVSPLFLYVICYLGIEGHVLRSLHRRYRTPVLRVGPNSVSISDSSALRDIYITNGGFPKDARYKNFNLGPIVSIFSAIDTEYRDQRAKAVAPLFAPARFMQCLSKYQVEKIPFDLVDLCARLSIDVVTEYLLGQPYGGFAETAHLSAQEQQSAKLSANPFIFAIVGFSRFSLLPNWLFQQVYRLAARLTLTEEAIRSFQKLDTFATQVMSHVDSTPPTATYQSRLLSAGISSTETAAQCKAIVFAGADSTAVMLTTILFHLIRNEDARHTLATEISAHRQRSPAFDPESVPYLRAVVKEGLRLGMANPTRLTRIIPPSTYLQLDILYEYLLQASIRLESFRQAVNQGYLLIRISAVLLLSGLMPYRLSTGTVNRGRLTVISLLDFNLNYPGRSRQSFTIIHLHYESMGNQCRNAHSLNK
ncbi:cytochrome P450 [Aspergillus tamarii]|uniref:Cytochrome P450 n=1 Tax=Aspergillus tamarii TaxID=41984 RepID=A0A5N6UXI3_ASPTM|nr:cytochrome P450 [Aspergillus tamarii]